ncbi:sugar transferase [Chitinophaga lutea]|nr:sugar transferase [Chitinophaga lutea]
METTAPITSLAPTLPLHQATVRAERIALFIGKAFPEVAFSAFFHRVMEGHTAKDGQALISDLLSMERKAPAAIFLDYSTVSRRDSESWAAYFKSYQALRTIPFFLLAGEITDEVKVFTKQCGFIDEVVTPACTEQQLKAKVEFISKIKRMQSVQGEKMAMPRAHYKGKGVSNFLKRSLDITAASFGLICAAPIMLVIAAAIRMESKGPIFYAAKRAGRNYKVFKFYKFRTMVPDADKKLQQLQHLNQYATDGKGPVFYKVSNDPRITKLGNFLRNSSLDELPQLFNVLKGDMSLVGNRPLPLYEATTLTTDEWVERFLAPAGITGLWQISKRGKAEMSVEERIQLDINYANKNTFAYDMWLMVNTPFALIQKDNV